MLRGKRCGRLATGLITLLLVVGLLPVSSLLASAQGPTSGASPSGLVAYLDRSNNLWVSDDTGANARQITTLGGYTGFVWSPDGTRLALEGPVNGGSGISIVSTDPAYGVRQLQVGSDPVWSPDSSQLAFISGDGSKVQLYSRDAGYLRTVNVPVSNLVWSPNTSALGFTQWVSDSYNAGCPAYNLGWINTGNGASKVVAHSFGKFAWAGDGSRLLYASTDDGQVHSYNIANDQSRSISSRMSDPCDGPFFTSADGNQLFFLDYGNGGGTTLVDVNLTTLKERTYPNLPISYPANYLPSAYVAVDPLAQNAYVVSAYPTTITRVNLSNGAQTTLLNNDAREVLGFSPDLTQVALLSSPYGKPAVTSIRDLATGQETAIMNAGWLAWQASPFTVTTMAAWQQTWAREDQPVASGAAHRTWLWGPSPFAAEQEQYAEAPGGRRAVEYFDKARMEVTNPAGDQSSQWYVTTGLLVVELITGKMQVGNNAFVTRAPAQIGVAGDPDDTSGPTYAALASLLNAPPTAKGSTITQTIDRQGNVGSGGPGGVKVAIVVPETNHSIADVFWNYLNSQGPIWNGSKTVNGPLFSPTFFATGYPVTEPYWATVKVGGTLKSVLIQCFQRRCLTYTPSNPAGWKVEMGNVGRHYYTWRYGTP